MQDLDFWKIISDTLYIGVPVCLVIMVDASGDGPNRPGSKMAVMPNGQRFGTVGGGNSEKMLSETAVELLTETPGSGPQWMTLNHGNDEDGPESGMICSGVQVFALLCLTPEDRPTVHQMLRALSEGIPGQLILSSDGLAFSETTEPGLLRTFDPVSLYYKESIGRIDTVTLIGGGHVSLALTPLLRSLNLRVVVLDNRPDLDTMQANTLAHDLRVIDYNNVLPHIPAGDRSYVCIMTFGHEHDETVLRQLVHLDLKYLGMMGSAHKIKTIFDSLRKQGVSQEKLDKIHSPIGLHIGSNTPEEIAVSIAAEIIAVKRGIIK